ncbi:MAG TPA: XdhC family protein [Syntrophomonas sp.]|nr:XdhC family protein [Syntrophomonas sp.]HRW11863.1 XdhC family protein [Syntrophomonas sp.]
MEDRDRIIITGSGNVAFYVYQFASFLDYEIVIFDNQEERLTPDRFPLASERIGGDIVENISSYEIRSTDSIVIVTHRHHFDEAVLKTVIASPARYIGVLSNRKQVVAYFGKLTALGIQDERLERIHAPIGLDLGGQKAVEIALSVVAEIQAVRYGRAGGFMLLKSRHSSKEKRDNLF